MKWNSIWKCKLLFLLCLLSQSVWAKAQYEKRKYVEKNYSVSSETELKLENKFGGIEINTWAKNEFDIKVEIIGKGRTEERAQRIIEAIDIRIIEEGSSIAFQTRINSSKSNNKEGFEINYTVYMPSQNPLAIKNSFGDVLMGDRDGDLKLHVSYGSFKLGNIKGYTELKLSFGSGSMNAITNGDVVVKYGNFDMESADKMELTQGFSDLDLGVIKNLTFEGKYGEINIEKANKVEAELHFSGFEIEELTGSLKLKCSYLGHFKIERLTKNFTLVDIDGKFSSYEIGLEPGLNANIDADFNFADLKVHSDVEIDFHYRAIESNRSTYRGKIGNGDKNKIIRIDSSYGNLKLKQD